MSDLRPGVLFDVDGTLADTNYLHAIAWARAFRDLGEWAPTNAIHRAIGMGGDQLVPFVVGHEVEGATDAWERHYKELLAEAVVFPGAADLLRAVAAKDVAVVLATSSPADQLTVLVERLDVDGVIDSMTNSDDVSKSKPDPEIFLKSMEVGSVDPRKAFVIGDSVWDVQAATAARLPCIGVESGGFSRHELSEAGAVHVYRDVQQVLDQLETGPLSSLFR